MVGVNTIMEITFQFGIVITGLEVVERGLSVLRLTTMPAYIKSVPTRDRKDFMRVI